MVRPDQPALSNLRNNPSPSWRSAPAATSHQCPPLSNTRLNRREGKSVAPHSSALTFHPSKLHSKSLYSDMAGNCESAEGGNPPDLQSRHGGNPPHDSQPPQSSSSPPPPTKPPPQQFQLLFISQEALGQVKGSEEEVPKLPPIIPGYMASNFTLGG